MNSFLVKWSVVLLLVLATGCQQSASTKPTQSTASTRNAKAAIFNTQAGAEYIKLGDYKFAMEKLEKALRQDPDLPSAHNTIGVLYQHLGEMDKAERHFERAVKLAPAYSEAQNNYGVFLCDQGRYKEAEQRFLIAISDPLYPNAAKAYENAGLCVNKIPDATLADKYFRTALQINPYLIKSLLKLADLNYQNIDYISARAYIERYHKIAQWTPAALLTAIKIESKLGEKNKVASYSILLKGQFPDSDEAQEVKQGHY